MGDYQCRSCQDQSGVGQPPWCERCNPEPPVTADHTPERLSAEEWEALRIAWRGPWGDALVPEAPARLVESVERILAAHVADVEARLAAVEALAAKWNDTPDYTASEYDHGRVDQRHDMTAELLAVLHPAPSEQPAQGGDDT